MTLTTSTGWRSGWGGTSSGGLFSQLTAVTGSRTVSADQAYAVRAPAGEAVVLTLPSSGRVRIWAQGMGSVFLNTADPVNGVAQLDVAIRAGADIMVEYVDGTFGWAMPWAGVDILPAGNVIGSWCVQRDATPDGSNVDIVSDLGPNGLNLLTPGAAPTLVTDGNSINGHLSARLVGASSQYLTCADNDAFDVTQYTSVWLVQPSQNAAQGYIYSHSNDTNNGIALYQTGPQFAGYENGSTFITGQVGMVNSGVPQIVGLVRGASTGSNGVARLYMGNQAYGYFENRAPLANSSDPFYVGRRSSGIYFSGAWGGGGLWSVASERIRELASGYFLTAYGLR